MAFEKLTLFEFDIEDATFGPRFEDGPATDEETTMDGDRSTEAAATASASADDEAASSGAVRRFLLLAGASVVVSVVATVVARRLFGEDEQTTMDEYTTDIEIEDGDETAVGQSAE
jgi:hypothetical protein